MGHNIIYRPFLHGGFGFGTEHQSEYRRFSRYRLCNRTYIQCYYDDNGIINSAVHFNNDDLVHTHCYCFIINPKRFGNQLHPAQHGINISCLVFKFIHNGSDI